jgi:hypothetical protein
MIYTLVMAFALKIIVFILGFLTIKMGNALLRDGIKGEFKFSTETKGIKGALESGSPGLLFVLLGIILIGYAMFVKKGVDLSEYKTNNSAVEQKPKDPQEGTVKPVKPNLGPLDTTTNRIKSN